MHTRHAGERGFTLLEILVVITIIAAIALMAIPRMLEARHAALETNAASYLRAVHQSQVQHQTREGTWTDLDGLRAKGYLRQELPAYTLVVAPSPDGADYTATATPVPRPLDMRHFFVDSSGVVRERTGAAADATASPSGG
jgi:prepilin-type N-terminal cleavage/methylation domain-containing protein